MHPVYNGTRFRITCNIPVADIKSVLVYKDLMPCYPGVEKPFTLYTKEDVKFDLEDKDGNKYKLPMRITIPKGFMSDGCSYYVDNLDTDGWLLHDWLFATHQNLSFGEANSVLDDWYPEDATNLLARKYWDSSLERGAFILKSYDAKSGKFVVEVQKYNNDGSLKRTEELTCYDSSVVVANIEQSIAQEGNCC